MQFMTLHNLTKILKSDNWSLCALLFVLDSSERNEIKNVAWGSGSDVNKKCCQSRSQWAK